MLERRISLIQWNLNSYKRKFSQLKLLIRKLAPACICLQETLITTLRTYPPSGYSMFHSPCDPFDGPRRGVGILIDNNFQYETINLDTTIEAIAIKLYLDKPYTICNIYFGGAPSPPKPPSFPPKIRLK